MASDFIVGRGIRVEIGTVEGAAKTVSAVTKASPAVATSAAHGLAAKSVGYFNNVTGMQELDGQVARPGVVDTNTFTLTGIDSSNYGTFTAGTFVPVTTWDTINEVTEYQVGGGEADQLDTTVLLDDIKQSVNGQLAAQTVTFPVRARSMPSAAMDKVEQVAKAGGWLVFRVTLKTGDVRVFRGQPSLPSESVATSAVGSGSFSVNVKGFVLKGLA